MKNKEAFEKYWHRGFPSNWVIRNPTDDEIKIWEACEEFYESRTCESCKYMSGYGSYKSEECDACNNNNKCSDCCPCNLWEPKGDL